LATREGWILRAHGHEDSYEEELRSTAAVRLTPDSSPTPRVEALLVDRPPQVILEGRMHPEPGSLARIGAALDVWPADRVRRIGFEFHFDSSRSPRMSTEPEADNQRVFEASLAELRARGAILRDDPAIGTTIVLNPIAELAIWSHPRSLTVSFQRSGAGDLWNAVREFPLNELLEGVLGRLPGPAKAKTRRT
jgi:hypothetical protein